MKMFLRTLSNQSKTERPKNLKKGSFVLWLPKRYEKANRVVLITYGIFRTFRNSEQRKRHG